MGLDTFVFEQPLVEPRFDRRRPLKMRRRGQGGELRRRVFANGREKLTATWPLGLALLICGVFATGALGLQIWAQRFVRAQRVALIFIMEPVCAAWMAWYVLDEHFGPRGWIGSALILVAVLLGSVLRSGPHMATPVHTTERRAT